MYLFGTLIAAFLVAWRQKHNMSNMHFFFVPAVPTAAGVLMLSAWSLSGGAVLKASLPHWRPVRHVKQSGLAA